jgi:hypothetical protein
MNVKPVTLLPYRTFIVISPAPNEVRRMLLLAAIAHLIPFRALKPDQGPNYLHPLLGHAGLTVIALVYVLIVMWQN